MFFCLRVQNYPVTPRINPLVHLNIRTRDEPNLDMNHFHVHNVPNSILVLGGVVLPHGAKMSQKQVITQSISSTSNFGPILT